MKLIVGLGNFGTEYENSRHNAGFLCLTNWSHKHKVNFSHDSLFDYLKVRGACLIKPNTYMNRSGLAMKEAMQRWKATDALVIHDDIELPLASIRLRNGGGDGGHNGVKSLLEVIPPDELKRIRIGIGRDSGDPKDFVLDDFSAGEISDLHASLDKVSEFIDIYIKHDFNSMLNVFSIWKKSCSGKSNTGNTRPKENNDDQEL